MMKTQQGSTNRCLRRTHAACAAVLCALMTVAGGAFAEGAAPTPVRPSHAHHGASEPVHAIREKSYAVSARGRRLAAQEVGPARPGKTPPSKSQARKPGESSAHEITPKTRPAPQSKVRRRKRPEDDDPAYDPPVMFKARAGRRGHAPALVRVHGRWMAREPISDPSRYAVIGPAPLRGSHDILVHQNLMADDEGLERIQDDYDLDRLRASHDLVDFEESRSLQLNPELPWDRRCARAWTVKFASDLASAFYAKFGEPLYVTSAARSVEYQMHLAHVNGNAAGIEGDVASPHLTGQAIDIGKRGMNRTQLAWMRSRLLPLIEAGEIDVEEEFKQACFHISVYRSYLPVTRALPRHELAQIGTQPGTQSATRPGTLRVPAIAPTQDPDPQQ